MWFYMKYIVKGNIKVFVSLSSLCFATDEDGCAVEHFCNTLFKCKKYVHK